LLEKQVNISPLEFIYTVVLRPPLLKKLANAVIRRIVPRTLNRHGAIIALNPNDPVISGALTLGVYERSETKFFLRVCRPGLTFLDIGANVGYYTALALSRMQNSGRIVALEPDPENFQYLQATIAANGGRIAVCLQKAASDQAGRTTLYTSRDNRGDNRLYANELCQGSCEVEVEPVDSMLTAIGIETVDLIKMDVQGYESHVLAGMKDIIRNSTAIVLLSEFWPDGLRRAGSDPARYLLDLQALGLNIFELTDGAEIVPVTNPDELIGRFPGRRYTNVVGLKGTISAI
jgi:FkbM family methyltransferase